MMAITEKIRKKFEERHGMKPEAAAEASGSRNDALVMCDGYDNTLVNWKKHSCEKKHQCSRYAPKGLRSYALCRNDSEYPYFIEREST